jgi:hypothetical protein
MPAANPTTKINSTRAKANETSLPGHELTLTMAFRMAVPRRGLFDGSPAGRLLENSDTAEVALEFIGIPPIVIGLRIVLKAALIRNPYVRFSLAVSSAWPIGCDLEYPGLADTDKHTTNPREAPASKAGITKACKPAR